MSDWRNCIVSYIDLVDTKSMFAEEKREAIEAMKALHKVVYGATQSGMPCHAHAYSWNDSVLLLAYCDGGPQQYPAIIKEVDDLKKRIDSEVNLGSYAISVKGMTIPEPLAFMGHAFDAGTPTQPRHVYIKASSMAFANCFKIESELGRKHKMDWYLDERIGVTLTAREKAAQEPLKMLPDEVKRRIFMYKGYLWD